MTDVAPTLDKTARATAKMQETARANFDKSAETARQGFAAGAEQAKASMQKGQEALQSTVEQMTGAGNAAFKDTVEKSLTALNELNAQSKQNLEAMVASVTAATKGAEALGAQAMAFSKASMEKQVAAARQLTGARSVQEVVELQTSFAKTAMESYLAEMNRMSETVAASVKDAMAPLNARMTAAVEKVQGQR